MILRNLQFSIISDGNIVEMLNASLNRNRFAHLHHRSAFFGLEEFDARHIAIEADQIEELIGVGSGVVQAIDHHDGRLRLALR